MKIVLLTNKVPLPRGLFDMAMELVRSVEKYMKLDGVILRIMVLIPSTKILDNELKPGLAVIL